ncbi:MAG: response regulator [Candidatus Eisenbacteria bacterium]|nr:response regulator [Candidatus Eisenbacteria bacterium]
MSVEIAALVVDDEKLARVRLVKLLEDIEGISVIGEAENGEEAVRRIRDLKPDLVFLDIRMPGKDGFGVIEALESVPLIVFVTAFDDYAVKAFEVNSIDYLLKPVNRARLGEAVGRARSLLEEPSDLGREIEKLKSMVRSGGLARLSVSRGKRILLLDLDDIMWLAVDDGLVFAHTGEGRFLVNRTMAELESRLDSRKFFRIHRSTIVNLDHVRELVPWFSGKYKVVMADRPGTELTLSRSRAKELREILPW